MMLKHSTFISTPLPLHDSQKIQLPNLGISLPVELERATAKRKDEFYAGRYCANTALLEAGCKNPTVGFRNDRSPEWPAGWVGSITHAKGFAAAAVAPSTLLLGLGIDFEPVMSSSTALRVMKRILRGSELDQGDDPSWVTLIFSAKESIYKCLRPLCGRYFGFEDAELIEVDERGFFRFKLTTDIGGNFHQDWQGEGTFEKKDGWIHTAVELLN